MRSKASVKSHPLHPILVSFPIAFFTGTLLFDLIGFFDTHVDWWDSARLLCAAGVIGALAAAIPGLIDYFYVVPSDSSAKTRATQHLIVNLAGTALFAIAWLVRLPAPAAPGWQALIAEISGLSLLTVGGWLGGTLVYRNQIGVDHRYAGAGRWSEEDLEEHSGRVRIGKPPNLKVNQMKLLHIGDRRIVLARTQDGFTAFADHCTHKGGSLADGVLACDTVSCPWHGSQFDVHTGTVRSGPARDSIATYRVVEESGELYLLLGQETRAARDEKKVFNY